MIEYKLVNAIANVESGSSGGGGSGGTGSGSGSVLTQYFKLNIVSSETTTHTGIDTLTEGTTYKFGIADDSGPRKVIVFGTMNIVSKVENPSQTTNKTIEFDSKGLTSTDAVIVCKKADSQTVAITVKLTLDRIEKINYNSEDSSATIKMYVFALDDEEMADDIARIELGGLLLDLIYHK